MRIKSFFMVLVAMILPLVASAEEVEIDGILYSLIRKDHTAKVISKGIEFYGMGAYAGYYVGDIVIPSSINHEGECYNVTSIGSSAFAFCSITSVSIPTSVVSIENGAFNNCVKLTSIVIPSSVTTIGASVFEDCTNLISVTVKGDVTAINDWTFGYCKNLTSISLPKSITTIGKSAFRECNKLTEISLGNNVESIESFAFMNCNSLLSVIIPNSTKSIGRDCFNGCSSLVSATIGSGMTSIGEGVFCGCSSLSSVDIPNNVTSISNDAFSGCSSLNSLTIGTGVTNIGISSFYKCINIDKIVVKEGNSVYDSRNECNAIFKTESNTLFLGCKGTIIPDGTESIGERAFWGCVGLTSVNIPSSITSIGNRAFEGCDNLSSIYITSLPAWCKIPFSNTNNPLSYANHLYLNEEEIKNLVIPDDVESIGNYTFLNCTGLKTITLSNNTTSIGEYSFSGCSDLENISIPSSVKTIGNYSFCDCTTLSSVIIGNSVNTIGKYAFYNCSNMTAVQIGKSVNKIDDYAFSHCKELLDVICLAKNVPSASSSVFSNSDVDHSILHVNELSINSYKAASPWNIFKSIVAADIPMYTLIYMVDGAVYKTVKYEEGDSITAEVEPTRDGYTFSGWSEIPKTMPAHDVTVTGTFTVDNTKYTLTYMVDGEVYKSYQLKAGSTIIPLDEPTKEGYTFSGWSDIPEEMPAHDVTVTSTFKMIPLGKCAAPTVSIVNGEIVFACEMDDVQYHYDIKSLNDKSGEGNNIRLTSTYRVSVYASKVGYDDSDMTIKDIQLLLYDANGDGVLNAADIVTIANMIMSSK